MKSTTIYQSLILLLGLCVLMGCKKEVLHDKIDAGQLVAGRLSGTWANPMNIETPADVPQEVFGNMRLVFTVDELGQPKEFFAQDCPIVFDSNRSKWSVSGNEEDAQVKLVGITPVDEMTAKIKGNTLTLSFYMGWENTETGKTGKGNFQVVLSRQ